MWSSTAATILEGTAAFVVVVGVGVGVVASSLLLAAFPAEVADLGIEEDGKVGSPLALFCCSNALLLIAGATDTAPIAGRSLDVDWLQYSEMVISSCMMAATVAKVTLSAAATRDDGTPLPPPRVHGRLAIRMPPLVLLPGDGAGGVVVKHQVSHIGGLAATTRC